jgi:hypothetical protein
MESVNSVRYKQCAVIEFLFAEKDSVKNIYKYLWNIYASATVDRSTVGRWVKSVVLQALTVGVVWAMTTHEDYTTMNGVQIYANHFGEI